MDKQKTGALTSKEQNIVKIAAFTAIGNIFNLKVAFNEGLNAGLAINEINEILIQLYAYCGFPRSLNGINTFMSVIEERKAKGVEDESGDEALEVESSDKYLQGQKTLEKLSGVSQSGPLTGANAFAPGIDVFLKEHLFADIFGRGLLTYAERELATITVLATIPGLEGQLQFHIGVGLNVGLTEKQLQDVFKIIGENIIETQAEIARTVLVKVMQATQ
ncbi:hypothetical protein ASG22_16240 [Chryseobacterium sp. Leaf405]|uniref:carboxymuconolactone decarboxylase family protein n=1 Tax=Chryseobacterium sp. Leaf405 TaxID=1736367 RepID=UPI0006F62170|nr:carboxymuconolactone decarboxylase family protein [Chryseobacterium sp. Leaf405]KQT20965.1 hypothetical protein ASG22_16240 [Chryseobacterium sp. Leaf405]